MPECGLARGLPSWTGCCNNQGAAAPLHAAQLCAKITIISSAFFYAASSLPVWPAQLEASDFQQATCAAPAKININARKSPAPQQPPRLPLPCHSPCPDHLQVHFTFPSLPQSDLTDNRNAFLQGHPLFGRDLHLSSFDFHAQKRNDISPPPFLIAP